MLLVHILLLLHSRRWCVQTLAADLDLYARGDDLLDGNNAALFSINFNIYY